MSKLKIYIVAGEPSGDLLASGLMSALRRRVPDVEFRGVGGVSMGFCGAVGSGKVGAGFRGVGGDAMSGMSGMSAEVVGVAGVADGQRFNSLFDISEIAVMGIFEVLPRLPLIMKRIRQTVDDIIEFQPDAVVTVDSWGFVSALLTRLRQKWRYNRQLSVIHYVAPQVWAWKKGRAKNVARLVDRLMTLLPDEGRYFEKYGLQCDFVGHPVVERVAEAVLDPAGFRASNSIPADATVVSVLPGSRKQEIRRLGPVFEKAAGLLRRKWDATGDRLRVELEVAADHLRGERGMAAEGRNDAWSEGGNKGANGEFSVIGPSSKKYHDGELSVIEPSSAKSLDERFNAFAASDVAIAKSGTVSLELAALGVPHLIAYKFGWLSNIAARLLVKVRYANLINILADREIIPEFVLWQCRPELIAESAYELLTDREKAERQVIDAQNVMQRLRLPDIMPSDRAAQIVLEMARPADAG